MLGGARKDDLGSTESLCKIMRGETNAQLREVETKFEPHRAAEPRIAAGIRRPSAFVEAAKHNAIGVLQPCLEQAQNADTRIAGFRWPPFGAPGAEQMENVWIIGCGKHERPRCFAVIYSFENALQLQATGVRICGNCAFVGGERLERFGVHLRQLSQADRIAGKRFQRCERQLDPLSQLFGGSKIGRRYEVARIVAMQFVPRCPESRERMRETRRATSWSRTAQNGALKRRYRTRVCVGL